MNALRTLVVWSLPALALAAGLLIYAGAPIVSTVAACAGLLLIVLIVYVLDRSGLMRPPTPQRSGDDSADRRDRG